MEGGAFQSIENNEMKSRVLYFLKSAENKFIYKKNKNKKTTVSVIFDTYIAPPVFDTRENSPPIIESKLLRFTKLNRV